MNVSSASADILKCEENNEYDIPFESILDSINEGICFLSTQGTVLYWNNVAEKLYGIKREEILNNRIENFFPNALCLSVLSTGKPVEYVAHRPREGSVLIISAVPIRIDGAVAGVVSIDQDITEFKRVSSELAEAKKRIKYLEYAEEVIKKNNDKRSFGTILYQSKQMKDVVRLAAKVAETDASVIITGESGTGKDLFANAIHLESSRHDAPFIVVDCSSISSSLIESELFGYERGAFTGAQRDGKPGKFEIANGGTVFLDEIGELPLEMQSKLLRTLDNREFYRVGGIKPIKINIRVIAATNRDIPQMVKEGTFRQDLLYRLNVFSLHIPALRERTEDIPMLMDYYLKRYSVLNNKVVDYIAPEIMAMLLHYQWPGNVRELKNVMERLVVLAEDNSISAQSPAIFLESILQKDDTKWSSSFKTLMEMEEALLEVERKIILNALDDANHNKVKTAKILDIPRSTLYYKLQKLDIHDENHKKGRPPKR